MKQLLLFLLITIATPVWSQITTDSLTGTWTWVDQNNKEQKLIITKNKVTVVQQYPVAPENKKWKTVRYSGAYTIVNDSTLHVIYWDDPREENFIHIVELKNGTMKVILSASEKIRTGEERVYRKE